jgi:hypothetical protein
VGGPLEENNRVGETKHWLERRAELDPGNKYANFYCGMILTDKARKLLPNFGRLPASPEPDLPSLRTKVGPLLEEASRHFDHALTLDRAWGAEEKARPFPLNRWRLSYM